MFLSRERAVNGLLRSLLAPDGRANPYPWYERFAQLGPVVTSTSGWAVVSGHEECAHVLRDPTFMTTGQARKTAGGLVVESGFTASMLGADGEPHRQQRRAMAGDFTGRMVEEMRSTASAAAARAIDSLALALERDGVADLMEHVAEPVPSAVVGGWSSAPEDDWPMLRRIAAEAHMIMEMGLRASQIQTAAASFAALRDYFSDMIVRVAGRREVLWPWSRDLPDAWVSSNLALISAAGTVTTSGLIGSTVLVLARHPDITEELAANPRLAKAVALEAHRLDGPAQVSCRVAGEDTTLGGVTVRAGSPVVVLLGAANRDPRMWPEPDQFDPRRENTDRALGFGLGRHRCLGTVLAIMQVTEVLNALLDRVGRLHVVGYQPRSMLSARGPESLLVRKAV